MTQVCQWLGYYLCMRGLNAPKSDTIHPDSTVFDAVIVWKEAAKEKSGGLAYEVILKPACTDAAPRPQSPPKERPISQEVIEKKLKDAEDRRQSVEQAKLALIAKDKVRQAEAIKKVDSLNSSFVKSAEEKLETKLEAVAEKKGMQIQALQERLRDHANRVEMVRATCDTYSNAQRQEIMERLEKKLSSASENRENQLKQIQERLNEHEKHISEVLDASSKFSKVTEEKMISKLEVTLKNREDQLKQLMNRLSEHEKRGEVVRENKLNRSQSEATS